MAWAMVRSQSCDSDVTCYLHATVLGSVLGCLLIWTEVPDRGTLQHDTAAQTVDSLNLWCDNWFYERYVLLFHIYIQKRQQD
jgi:hypothetical protein